jgi:hypothetical protein
VGKRPAQAFEGVFRNCCEMRRCGIMRNWRATSTGFNIWTVPVQVSATGLVTTGPAGTVFNDCGLARSGSRSVRRASDSV